MAKKCPPGFICFENVSLMILIIILLVTMYYVFSNMKYEMNKSNNKQDLVTTRIVSLPVNVTTNSLTPPLPMNTQRGEFVYKQVGILTRVNGSNLILPLFGRMINTSRVKWQYYTMNESNNSIRLPINVKGRNGTDEYGVDELYSGDTVYVEGYDEVFKATIYKNSNFYYSPF
tara:strand:+ start:863 stop:1381 length:519 start_codon:yes stop_codon:yes gene_type:complete